MKIIVSEQNRTDGFVLFFVLTIENIFRECSWYVLFCATWHEWVIVLKEKMDDFSFRAVVFQFKHIELDYNIELEVFFAVSSRNNKYHIFLWNFWFIKYWFSSSIFLCFSMFKLKCVKNANAMAWVVVVQWKHVGCVYRISEWSVTI